MKAPGTRFVHKQVHLLAATGALDWPVLEQNGSAELLSGAVRRQHRCRAALQRPPASHPLQTIMKCRMACRAPRLACPAVLPPAMPAEGDLGDAAGAVHGLTLETVFERLQPPEVSVIEPPRVSWGGCNGLSDSGGKALPPRTSATRITGSCRNRRSARGLLARWQPVTERIFGREDACSGSPGDPLRTVMAEAG